MVKLAAPRKRGRPRKVPGAPVVNWMSAKMQVAILAIVDDNKSCAEAAKLAGLSEIVVRKSMRNNAKVREFFAAQVKLLKVLAKAKAAHTLIKELDGPNAAARVAAARTLLDEAPQSSAGNGMAAIPGFTIMISDGRAQAIAQQPIDVTPLNGALAPRSQADRDG